jgi:two-component system sensor histidine kinase/response regulator
MSRSPGHAGIAVRYALVYTVGAALWIFASDEVLSWLAPDPRTHALISVAKGWAFVLVTALAFYVVLRRVQAGAGTTTSTDETGAGVIGARARRAVFAVVAGIAILASGAAAIGYTASRQRDAEFARLQAIAELRADRLASWMAERRQDARTVALDGDLIALAQAANRSRHLAPEQEIDAILESHRRESAYASIALVDDAGAIVRAVGPHDPRIAAALRAAIARALDTGRPAETDLYLGADGAALLDIVAPLGRHGRDAGAGAVVLRVNAAGTLFPLLTQWPFPSRSGETELLREEGGVGLVLSPLRFAPDAALTRRAKLDRADGIVKQVLRNGAIGRPVEGVDYRGVPVIASAAAVAGTRWILIAKVDRAEFGAAARRDALWIGLTALLALAAVAFAVQLLHEQQTLRLTRELKDRQDEALRSAELLGEISRSSSDAIFARDLDGRHLLVNDAATRITGIPVERMLGRDATEIFPPDVADEMTRNDREVLARGAAITREHRMPSPSGERALLTTIGPIRDPAGRITGTYGIARDVTEQARANAELERYRNHLEELVRQRTAELERANHELERRAAEFASLYNDAPCGYDSIDPSGLVTSMNDFELRWLGYRREEVVGVLRITDLLTPATRARFDERMRMLESSGGVHEMEAEFVRRDGSTVAALVSATAHRDADGRLVEVRATVVDATERRARDRELARLADELQRRAVEAEAASRAKSAFLANMSHEIRTPLNAIVGLTHLVRRTGTDATQHDRLDKVVEAADHLLAVINDILDISKIEAGKLTLEASEVDVRALLEQVRAWAAERAAEKGLELRVEVDEAVPGTLVGDATRLRQVLLNYASNAVKFTSSGAIVLRARATPRGDRIELRFEVEDTGVGVSAEVQRRLFSAFEQGDDSTTRRHGGTGLGLAINRLIAREMDGDVGVSSVEGRGSLFWFTALLRRAGVASVAPAVDDARERLPDEETLRAWWLGTRVLLTEDNPINREVAEELLAEIGLAVDVAVDGDAAVARAREHQYALILMDVQMPVMDGFDATRAIRGLSWHAHTPIVAMTAAATLEDRVRARAAGMDDFISKPFTPSSLHRVLWRWLPHGGSAARRGEAPNAAARATAIEGPWTRIPADARAADRGAALVARLSAVPGLDVERALPYSGRDGVRYIGFLQRFLASAAADVAAARAAVAAGDRGAARRAMHSLKGAAAFAGALEIRRRATELEPQAADADIDAASLDAPLDRLAAAVASLGDAVATIEAELPAPPAVATTGAPPDPARIASTLARLAELLDQGDASAARFVAAESATLRAGLGQARAVRVARHVEAFEYEAALAQLNEARAQA